MSITSFPQHRIGNPRLASMRCVECGAADIQIIALPNAGLMAFCSPACAAGCGIEPWASADLVCRMTWIEGART
jgi:hypothetical protein